MNCFCVFIIYIINNYLGIVGNILIVKYVLKCSRLKYVYEEFNILFIM